MNIRKMKNCILLIVSACWFVNTLKLYAQDKTNVSGVYPHLAMVADQTPRTEAGTGALVPWAPRLWGITYVAHVRGPGSGTGV